MPKRALLLIITCLLVAIPIQAQSANLLDDEQTIKAIRFDPAYYYKSGKPTARLARELVQKWDDAGINTVYFLSYSHVYGARYITDYLYNTEESFGRRDLLGIMLPMMKAKGMKVIVWFFDHQHKGAWTANPDWRVRTKDGRFYRNNPYDYYLSVHHPEVREYLQGFVEDILENYPDVDGIDITEPIVNWWGNEADFSDHVVKQFREKYPDEPLSGYKWLEFKSEGLTTHIQELTQLVQSMGKEVHLTTVFTATANGRLLSPREYRNYTGFDLEAILSGDDVPDYLNGEIIWQTWADAHGAGFSPQWTKRGVKDAMAQVAGRTPFIAHVEISRFGSVQPDVEQFGESLKWALAGGARHLDFYDSHQTDQAGAWSAVNRVYRSAEVGAERPLPRVENLLSER